MRANTQTVTIAATPQRVYDFVADPENLPRWAIGFAKAVHRDGDGWRVATQGGEMPVTFITDAARGVIDFVFEPAPGINIAARSRVLPNGDDAEYVFTQFQESGMPDAMFDAQVQALHHELEALKAHLEVACPW